VQVWRAKSVDGLSLTSNIVELLCYTVVFAYNISQVGDEGTGSQLALSAAARRPPMI
jgi:hypothetical protein